MDTPGHPISTGENEPPPPRGPISDELTYHGARRCHAKSTQSGERCKKAAIVGGTVCATHGGAAGQVKQAAAVRNALALLELVPGAVAEMGRIMAHGDTDQVRLRASFGVLNRTGFPEQVNVGSGDDAQRLLVAKLVELRDAGRVIEGVIVDDDGEAGGSGS